MISLFPDQQKMVSDLRIALKKNRRVLLQAATGFGKSIVAASIISGTQAKGKTSIFVVPRRQLIDQMSDNFRKFNIEHGFIAAGYSDKYLPTQIASLETIANRDFLSPDAMFFDECHFSAEKIGTLQRGSYNIGLSATPWLYSGKGMGEWWDAMVSGPSIEELIRLKRLSDFRYFAPSEPDLSGIKISDGDFQQRQLNDFMEKQNVITGDAIATYKKHAMGKLNITFCTGRKHSQMTADAFCAAGVPSMHVDGETPDDERGRIFRAYGGRDIINLCCAELLIFGFDLEAASGMKVTVESMIDLGPTKSVAKQKQKWGRVLRAKSEPAWIFDHVGNFRTHGFPDFPVDWSLKDRTGKPSVSIGGIIPMAQCEKCFRVFRPAPICPHCGYERTVKEKKLIYREGDLQEITRQAAQDAKEKLECLKREEKREIAMARSYADFREIGRRRGYAPGWALIKAKKRGYV